MSDTEPTSLRAYFAANAPADPPAWFKPEMDKVLPLPPEPSAPAELEDYLKTQGSTLYRDVNNLPATSMPIKDLDVQRMFTKHKEDVQEHQKRVGQIEQPIEQRYFAWRWYYAEQMVKANPNANAWAGAL